jgi:hypothetical protein
VVSTIYIICILISVMYLYIHIRISIRSHIHISIKMHIHAGPREMLVIHLLPSICHKRIIITDINFIIGLYDMCTIDRASGCGITKINCVAYITHITASLRRRSSHVYCRKKLDAEREEGPHNLLQQLTGGDPA